MDEKELLVKTENNTDSENNVNCNKRKKSIKILIIVLSVIILAIIISGIIVGVHIRNEEIIREKAIAERELNEKLEKCYIAINDNYDYDEYKKIVSSIQNENEKDKAYGKLDAALKKQIEELSKEYTVEKYYEIYDLLKDISDDAEESNTEDSKKIQQIVNNNKKVYYYNDYMRAAKLHEDKGNYLRAYECYTSAIKESSGMDEEKRSDATTKKQAIKTKACEYLKKELEKKIKSKDYTSYYSSNEESLVENSGDAELKKLYKQFNDAKNREELRKEKEKKKQRGVNIGMTKQQVLDSMWGEPEKINKTTTAYGTSEQWVYPNNNYLYFENGILTAIQN